VTEPRLIWRRLWRGAVRTVWPAGTAVIDRFNKANGSVLSGYFAYIAMLAFFPFLIFATALTGFLVGPENSVAALDMLFQPFPDHVRDTLSPVIHGVISERRSGVLTFAGLGALWAASNGLDAVRIGFDQAYAVEDSRRYAVNRIYLFVMVLLCVVAFMLLTLFIIAAPLVFSLLDSLLGIRIPFVLGIIRYGLSALILLIVLWLLHRILPSRRMRGLRLWPGIFASTLVWGLVATGMSVYLAYAPAYSLTYGALAGVIVTLLFFYLTGASLLLGAHVNAMVNGLGPPRADPTAAPVEDETADDIPQI